MPFPIQRLQCDNGTEFPLAFLRPHGPAGWPSPPHRGERARWGKRSATKLPSRLRVVGAERAGAPRRPPPATPG
jgi:hypothetical protein